MRLTSSRSKKSIADVRAVRNLRTTPPDNPPEKSARPDEGVLSGVRSAASMLPSTLERDAFSTTGMTATIVAAILLFGGGVSATASVGAQTAAVREAADEVRQIVGHRGSCVDRPENTLASFRRAIEAGATTVEVDVRTTSDGYLVVLHDATLDRTTDGTGPVGDHTLEELRRFDAGGWFDPRYRGERVPTLDEVLALCRFHGVEILLDLKEEGETYARSVAAAVRAAGDPRRTIVGVRSPAQALLFRDLLPESRQLGFIPRPGEIEAFAEAGVETIRLWAAWLEDKSLVRRVSQAGAALHLNVAVCGLDEIGALLKHRPRAILCDDPARLVATLAKLRGHGNDR
jgi:glycerophosphoryl diester phosphodiesterase